jgi:hypothetical protein
MPTTKSIAARRTAKGTDVEAFGFDTAAWSKQIEQVPWAVDDDDPGANARTIDRIMKCATEEELLSSGSAESLADYVGETITILPLTAERRESKFRETTGLPFFIVCDFEHLGEIKVLTCSALKPVMQIIAAHNKGWDRLTVEIAESPTKRGFRVYSFVKPVEPF